MRGDILARIPADNGNVIRIGGNSTMVVAASPCESDCSRMADVIIQGETDSFGFEPICLCQQCADRIKNEEKTYKEALDIEDRAPSAGHLFLVSTCTNYDRYDWCQSFTSFRKASAFLRRCETMAEPFSGLYPQESRVVKELPEEEVKARVKRYDQQRLEELFPEDDFEEPAAYDDDDYDYSDDEPEQGAWMLDDTDQPVWVPASE